VKGHYHVIEGKGKSAERALAAFYKANGQQLLPLVELIEQARLTVSSVLDEVSQQTIEMILQLSAEQLAGPRTPGKASGEIRWHGSQAGRVSLEDRQVNVRRPRLRQKGQQRGGEVEIPAYRALQKNPAMGERMFGALLRGVSTRQYHEVLPCMAETAGVSKSAVSERAIEASAAQLEELLERRWDSTELLVIYIDGMQFGGQHVISAVGVDLQGHKHVLGLQQGATENTAAVKSLLVHLREHGVRTGQRYLFVIDGAKALRAGIAEVFGSEQAVQRCRAHKIRNVLEELPQEQHAQVRSLMRAAYRLERAEEGMAKMEKMASWLEREYPTAASSLREGLPETFTINRLGLPPSLHRCLGTTNLIESPQSGVRKRTGNVTRWRDGEMVLRWVAGAYLLTEKHFRKIMGYENLWALAAVLGREKKSVTLEEKFA
jgi:transposase-like protein